MMECRYIQVEDLCKVKDRDWTISSRWDGGTEKILEFRVSVDFLSGCFVKNLTK